MDTPEMVACTACGAHNPVGAEWCSQCYAVLAVTRVEEEREEQAGAEERRFAHPTEYASFVGKPVYSRWAASETSFGPFGRIVLTVLTIALGVALAFNYSPIPAVIWLFVAAPVIIRSIWKRVPVSYAVHERVEIGPAERTPEPG